MTTNPPADAAKLRALLEKAIDRPWRAAQDGVREMRNITAYIEGANGALVTYGHLSFEHRDLIVESVNALPALLDLLAAQASQIEALTKENDGTYELGKRDGYEFAVQCIDIETGGDGEYRYCMGDKNWPETHCPDAGSMKIRISNRFTALQSRATAAEAKAAKMQEALRYARNLIGPDEIVDAALDQEARA